MQVTKNLPMHFLNIFDRETKVAVLKVTSLLFLMFYFFLRGAQSWPGPRLRLHGPFVLELLSGQHYRLGQLEKTQLSDAQLTQIDRTHFLKHN